MRRIILACALASIFGVPAFGQQAVDPEEGIYQLNLAKSTIRGAAPRTQTLNIGKETFTAVGFDANGKPYTNVFPTAANNPDGVSRPVTGSPLYDASKATRMDPYTVSFVRTKDGKVVEIGTRIYNPESKTITTTLVSAGSAAGSYSHIMVYEKQ
jgi:hypothetical protein